MESIAFMAGYVVGIGLPIAIGITVVYFISKKLSGKKIKTTQA